MKNLYLVGTYTDPILFGTGEIFQGKGEGIYSLTFDPDTGLFGDTHLLAKTHNPSFLCTSHNHDWVCCVNELKSFDDKDSGSVSSFKYVNHAEDSMTLDFLSVQATKGTDPCHLALTSDDKTLAVANFMSGSTVLYSVTDDGLILPSTDFKQHEGKSVHPLRQKSPHAHAVIYSGNDRYCWVPDLGTDKVYCYDLAIEPGKLTLMVDNTIEADPGDGPRSGIFNKGETNFYLINEISSSISVYSAQDGLIKERIQKTSTLSEVFTGNNICADIKITRDGKFLIASNRGENSIVLFSIDNAGSLHQKFRVPCGGRTPRSFNLDVGDSHVLVCNQDSDNITAFFLDRLQNTLHLTDDIEFPSPVCIIPFPGR